MWLVDKKNTRFIQISNLEKQKRKKNWKEVWTFLFVWLWTSFPWSNSHATINLKTSIWWHNCLVPHWLHPDHNAASSVNVLLLPLIIIEMYSKRMFRSSRCATANAYCMANCENWRFSSLIFFCLHFFVEDFLLFFFLRFATELAAVSVCYQA